MAKAITPYNFHKGFKQPSSDLPWLLEDQEAEDPKAYISLLSKGLIISELHNWIGINLAQTWPTLHIKLFLSSLTSREVRKQAKEFTHGIPYRNENLILGTGYKCICCKLRFLLPLLHLHVIMSVETPFNQCLGEALHVNEQSQS